MNRNRILFIVLVVAAAIGLGLVFWYVLRPVLPGTPATKTEQPPALPPSVPFDPSKTAPQPPQPTGEPVDTTSPEERERQAQEALKRQAMDYASRQGTYSNADDYRALVDAQANVTVELATKLEDQRTLLRRSHPAFGPSYSQTIRSLSASIDATSVPLLNRSSATVRVQAQQITEEQGKARGVATVVVIVSFVKQGDNWIPSDVTLEAYNP